MKKVFFLSLILCLSVGACKMAVESIEILSGDFEWDEELHGKWFYQRPSDPDLIILRSWVDGK
jgi:hypothetical protein